MDAKILGGGSQSSFNIHHGPFVAEFISTRAVLGDALLLGDEESSYQSLFTTGASRPVAESLSPDYGTDPVDSDNVRGTSPETMKEQSVPQKKRPEFGAFTPSPPHVPLTDAFFAELSWSNHRTQPQSNLYQETLESIDGFLPLNWRNVLPSDNSIQSTLVFEAQSFPNDVNSTYPTLETLSRRTSSSLHRTGSLKRTSSLKRSSSTKRSTTTAEEIQGAFKEAEDVSQIVRPKPKRFRPLKWFRRIFKLRVEARSAGSNVSKPQRIASIKSNTTQKSSTTTDFHFPSDLDQQLFHLSQQKLTTTGPSQHRHVRPLQQQVLIHNMLLSIMAHQQKDHTEVDALRKQHVRRIERENRRRSKKTLLAKCRSHFGMNDGALLLDVALAPGMASNIGARHGHVQSGSAKSPSPSIKDALRRSMHFEEEDGNEDEYIVREVTPSNSPKARSFRSAMANAAALTVPSSSNNDSDEEDDKPLAVVFHGSPAIAALGLVPTVSATSPRV
jgi:hypothetical protein